MRTATTIPIQNIYYLLAYAWDFFRSGRLKDISPTDCPDSVNLLAHLLARGITGLANRGFEKDYHLQVEETPRLRGRFDLLDSYRRATHLAGRLTCEFDELTADTLANQILKTTCKRLLASRGQLEKNIRGQVHKANDLMRDVSTIALTGRDFRRVKIHRNNRHYRLLINVCQLLHDCFLPTEQEGKGRFEDFLDNETVMNQLFEKFVLNFSKQHCHGAKVKAMGIEWSGNWDAEVDAVLPRMRTDVTIAYRDHKTILDCKFYREALKTRYDKHRLHSNHLYQLTAYLQNKAAADEGWRNVRGVLLYPAVNHHLDLQFELLGFPVEIHSVDLDQEWRVIEERLRGVVRRKAQGVRRKASDDAARR